MCTAPTSSLALLRRYDKYCPFYKSCDMLRNMITFYSCANDAVERTAAAAGADAGAKLSFNVIKTRLSDLLYKLRYDSCVMPASQC
jgi:V-type H+-transporting ATPase subunit A